ncbi:UBA domain-containing protein [Durusdinium trenchii]|uniref:UBA domain-containing protein n=1 Tax=Durusdinium trenchii TaxID=1381693 RepID=A0ABP0JEM4_9DINO
MKGVDSLTEGLTVLAESTTTGLSSVDDPLIKADCCKMKEAMNAITRADAPHSAIAKLRRDMDFNIMNPLRCHIVNNRNMKNYLDKRRRRLLEFNIAKREMEDCVKKNLHPTDRKYLAAQSQLESAKLSFHEVDKHIFEWLYILEEYKGDILDSCLQTLKYLQYEFFATSAHSISGVLPARMEFRPMVEMTPDHLEAQVEMALQEEEENPDEVVTDFSARLIEKLAKDNKNKPGEGLDSAASEGPAVPVDPLSLSSLLSQGFEEGPARQALRKFKNNTQAALDFLIGGGQAEEQEEEPVRMPTTERRRAQQARRKEEEERRRRDAESPERTAKSSPREAESRSPLRGEMNAARPSSAAVDLLDFQEETKASPASPPDTGAPRPAGDLLDLAPGSGDLLDLEPPAWRLGGIHRTMGSTAKGHGEADGFAVDWRAEQWVKSKETLPLPEQITLDLSKCEKGPIGPGASGGYA